MKRNPRPEGGKPRKEKPGTTAARPKSTATATNAGVASSPSTSSSTTSSATTTATTSPAASSSQISSSTSTALSYSSVASASSTSRSSSASSPASPSAKISSNKTPASSKAASTSPSKASSSAPSSSDKASGAVTVHVNTAKSPTSDSSSSSTATSEHSPTPIATAQAAPASSTSKISKTSPSLTAIPTPATKREERSSAPSSPALTQPSSPPVKASSTGTSAGTSALTSLPKATIVRTAGTPKTPASSSSPTSSSSLSSSSSSPSSTSSSTSSTSSTTTTTTPGTPTTTASVGGAVPGSPVLYASPGFGPYPAYVNPRPFLPQRVPLFANPYSYPYVPSPYGFVRPAFYAPGYSPYYQLPPPFPYAPPVSDSKGPPHFSIDVECSASGPTHNDRIVSQVALVDCSEKVILNFYVKPTVPVFSTLSELTGITKQDLDKGVSLEEGIRLLKEALPKNAILLGQNILQDIQWLGLVEGQDYASLLDLAGLFRVFNAKFQTWSYHSLQHKTKYLLGAEQYDCHNAATDAIWSVRLFNLYKRIEKDPLKWGVCQEILLNAPNSPSFAALHPTLDGVCMGNRRSCTCGAPFFG